MPWFAVTSNLWIYESPSIPTGLIWTLVHPNLWIHVDISHPYVYGYVATVSAENRTTTVSAENRIAVVER